jgi:hypothetical protein
VIQAGLIDQSLFNPHYRDIGVLVVFAVSAVALGVRPLLDSLEVGSRAAGSWLPTLGGLTVLAAFGTLLASWSRRPRWNRRHNLAVAAGALVATGVVAFTVRPIGHVAAFDLSRRTSRPESMAFVIDGLGVMPRQVGQAADRR